VSLWLNSGVPATEVARRAGHGVAVLLKIYAHCIDGQATAANQRIADALGTQDAEEDLGDEGRRRHRGGILKWQVRVGIRAGAVSMTAPTGPVRGLFSSRPWAGPCPSVGRSASVRGPREPRNQVPTDA
jgi:hypothetical protein